MSDSNAQEALQPCPFCGAHADDGGEGPELRVDEKGCRFVFCFGCGATGPQHAFAQTEAVPSWNRRAAASNRPEPVRKLREALEEIISVDVLSPEGGHEAVAEIHCIARAALKETQQ